MNTLYQHLAGESLNDALARLEAEIKARPADADLRAAFVQFLTLSGNWTRALTQLKSWLALKPQAKPTVTLLEQSIQGELQRAQVMAFNNQQLEAPLFSDALEAEVIELAAHRSEEGVNWFNRVMGILGKGQKTDDQRFSQLHQVVEAVAQSQADQIDRFSALEQDRQQDKATIQQLTSELNELRGQLQLQPAENYSARPAATGNSSAQLADF